MVQSATTLSMSMVLRSAKSPFSMVMFSARRAEDGAMTARSATAATSRWLWG